MITASQARLQNLPERLPYKLAFDDFEGVEATGSGDLSALPNTAGVEASERLADDRGRVAQGLEHLAYTERVGGSNPSSSTTSRRDSMRTYQRRWMRDRRQAWFASQVCAGCGTREGLQLHHIDAASKTSHRIWSWSAPRRLAELAKCEARCGKCHSHISASQSKTRSSAGFRGVYRHQRLTVRPFSASITVNKQKLFLGYFVSAEEAARAYDAVALSRFGSIAPLNFPEPENG